LRRFYRKTNETERFVVYQFKFLKKLN